MLKEKAVASLGQPSLLMPAWIKAALAANDRLKLYLAQSPECTRHSSQVLLEFALEVPCSRQNQTEAKRLSVLMAKLGWQHKANVRFGKQSMTGYVSPEDPTFKA